MSETPILKPEKSYTFKVYFEMPFEPEDILAKFNYSLKRMSLNLEKSIEELDRLTDLKSKIEETLPYVSLTSETARRELLIAPILLDLIHYTQAQLRIDYPLNVSHKLKGLLDYYLYRQSKVLIVAAKNANLSRGFTQLAVELIALDQWINSEESVLNGAVSTGNIWQFAVLDRNKKQVTQDLNLYRVPADLEEVMGILVAMLKD